MSISPTAIYEATTVSCTPSGWSDPDGDSPGYKYAWLINGSPVSTASTISGSLFKRGDLVACRVTPNDGLADGTPVTSTASRVLNTKPVLASASLSTTSPKEGDTITVVPGTASDADGDSISYKYQWFVNSKLVSSGTSLSSAYFKRGDTIYAVVTPYDGYENGASVTTPTATAVNTGPVISSVTLSPTSPKTNDVVVSTVVASDGDGDSLTYTYEWYVNGVKQSWTRDRLEGKTFFDKHETVQVKVTVSDGSLTATRSSAVITAVNTAPSITTASISPATVKEGDTITCTPSGWSDADGDSAGYKYAWLNKGSPISGATGSTLDSGKFKVGDSIQCRITPWDGEHNGTAVTSGTTTVLNTPPKIDSVTISPASPKEGNTVTASISGAYDADGHSISYKYQWYVNGSMVHTGSSLPSSKFNKHQDIYVRVTPNDGFADGTTVESNTVKAVNTPPVLSGVKITPATLYTNTAAYASYSTSDADATRARPRSFCSRWPVWTRRTPCWPTARAGS